MLADQDRYTTHGGERRIGIIGGTFDPIHYAHLAIAEEAYHELKLERVLFVPAGQPPHKNGMAVTSVVQRLDMLKLAIADNPHFALSLVDVQRAGPSYTVDTLRLLHQEWGPQVRLFFIIGGDSLNDLPRWHRANEISAQATIVALMRPGYHDLLSIQSRLSAALPDLLSHLVYLQGPRMEISSTDLRQRVQENRPIAYQTPKAVEHYIFEHGLYRSQEVRDKVAECTESV